MIARRDLEYPPGRADLDLTIGEVCPITVNQVGPCKHGDLPSTSAKPSLWRRATHFDSIGRDIEELAGEARCAVNRPVNGTCDGVGKIDRDMHNSDGVCQCATSLAGFRECRSHTRWRRRAFWQLLRAPRVLAGDYQSPGQGGRRHRRRERRQRSLYVAHRWADELTDGNGDGDAHLYAAPRFWILKGRSITLEFIPTLASDPQRPRLRW